MRRMRYDACNNDDGPTICAKWRVPFMLRERCAARALLLRAARDMRVVAQTLMRASADARDGYDIDHHGGAICRSRFIAAIYAAVCRFRRYYAAATIITVQITLLRLFRFFFITPMILTPSLLSATIFMPFFA